MRHQLKLLLKNHTGFQSTHPRGVRLTIQTLSVGEENFNPRTHVGCDWNINCDWSALGGEFQSTHPRGVRRRCCPCWYLTRYFNPRTHVGCDARPSYTYIRVAYFNPRTHVGCDTNTEIIRSCRVISIHAPTWGATPSEVELMSAQSISIHAPTWGATVKPSNGWLLGHKDNEFANENIIIINSVNIT